MVKKTDNMIREVEHVDIVNKSSFELPEYGTADSAGVDLRADFKEKERVDDFVCYGGTIDIIKEDDKITTLIIKPGCRIVIPTNLYIKLPIGYELQIRPRSGISLKKGLQVMNTPGTIDSDYIGNIGVILFNPLPNDFIRVEHSEKIAQAVLSSYKQISWNQVDTLEETERGSGGYGHTDKK